MTISSVIDTITNTLDTAKTPVNILPPLLLKCLSLIRPGLSAYKMASTAIVNNGKLGIPTGPNPDGSPNMVNQFTYNIFKVMVESIKNDAVVHVDIPAGTLLIQATGANAGGPVTVVGFNMLDSLGSGIMS